MTIHLGNVPASTTIYLPFCTYDASGASVTMTGFATSDILIYKNGSVTQRSSTAGFTLLDTDGTDFDGITGLHGFSIDLSDNTDAGFYSVGGFYWIVVSTVTVSTQVVTALVATFRLVAAETVAGYTAVDTFKWLGGTIPAVSVTGVPLVDLKYTLGTISPAAAGSVRADAVTGAVGSVTGNVGGNVTGSVGSVTAAVALTSGERTSVADALLDRTDGVETGLTPRQAWRVALSATGGKVSGAATTTNTFRNAVADTKNRIIATVDVDGNRTAITYDLT